MNWSDRVYTVSIGRGFFNLTIQSLQDFSENCDEVNGCEDATQFWEEARQNNVCDYASCYGLPDGTVQHIRLKTFASMAHANDWLLNNIGSCISTSDLNSKARIYLCVFDAIERKRDGRINPEAMRDFVRRIKEMAVRHHEYGKLDPALILEFDDDSTLTIKSYQQSFEAPSAIAKERYQASEITTARILE